MACTSVLTPSRTPSQHKGSRGSRCRELNLVHLELQCRLLLLSAIRRHPVPPALRVEPEPAEVQPAEEVVEQLRSEEVKVALVELAEEVEQLRPVIPHRHKIPW